MGVRVRSGGWDSYPAAATCTCLKIVFDGP